MLRLVFSIAVFFFLVVDAKERIHVAIYYESLCPDSQRFIKNQFYPTWKDLRDYMDVEFIPFGKSASDNLGNFRCQHGPSECKGNKLQSCALSLLTPWGPKEEFVNCVMSSSDPVTSTRICAGSLNIPWSSVEECYKDGTGTNLQLKAEKETYNVQHAAISYVPTIIINDSYNQKNQRDAMQDFRGLICKLIGTPAPQACTFWNRFF